VTDAPVPVIVMIAPHPMSAPTLGHWALAAVLSKVPPTMNAAPKLNSRIRAPFLARLFSLRV
jgi:hypothetical protein